MKILNYLKPEYVLMETIVDIINFAKIWEDMRLVNLFPWITKQDLVNW